MKWDKKDIIAYYLRNELAYRMWGPDMHYGYWEKGIRTQRQASLRFNQKMAEIAGLNSSDHVLDAGCGVGGCSVFMAKTYGCRVTGITITPRQVELANMNAKKNGVSHLTEFYERDYQDTGFDDKSFDLVWGLESICYAESKKKFIEEASRILKDNGRLIVGDGFASREEYHGKDARLMQRWLDGWIVNFLNTPVEFARFAEDAGFRKSEYYNVTDKVWKTSIIMLLVSLPFFPLHMLDKIFHFKSYPTDALYHQFFAMKKGLWEYGIFFAGK